MIPGQKNRKNLPNNSSRTLSYYIIKARFPNFLLSCIPQNESGPGGPYALCFIVNQFSLLFTFIKPDYVFRTFKSGSVKNKSTSRNHYLIGVSRISI